MDEMPTIGAPLSAVAPLGMMSCDPQYAGPAHIEVQIGH